jgi:small-conductance mechanosensitive channel
MRDLVLAGLFWPIVAFVAVTAVALALRSALLAGLRRWSGARQTASAWLAALRVPSLLWSIVLGFFAAIQVADDIAQIPRRLAERLNVLLEAAIILSVTVTLAGVLASVVATASERRSLGVGVTSWARMSVRLVVLVLGLLVLLSSLGIQITPLLTALGVGGLAVALALQDTLSNLFAGMHLLADKPIRVGDYVRFPDGVEGFVADIGWRSTRIRTLQNNVVIMPNKRVAESVITNFDLPEARMSLLVPVPVDYASDPDRVEAILIDEALRSAAEVAGLLAEPKPFVRFIPGFGDSGLTCTLICQVASFVDQFEAQHVLRKRILRRFGAEGIAIPFPARTVHLRTPDGDRSRAPSA